ncbi:LuxR C-terminal-related transcriptional regulator [Streptomyces brasiliensis]|uniref:HTH luxR-type domain-containing protein n=1 Tax=Streptomyces brasiliensis TaxID=1954 RepID=A0A917KHS2_9ACTN|nr:response regulator transcription factor [Streptomyces brasiliensis]GGJ12969.1 hypothetical protein GCM10010121_024170 [Streptomyces brasiliensis]
MNRLRSLAVGTFGPRALAAVLYGVLSFPLALAGFVLTVVGLVCCGCASPTTDAAARSSARAALRLRAEHPRTGVLLFSQYVETTYASRLLGDPAGFGYLLKERVVDIGEFVGALERVAAGGTALDPEVVAQLFGASRRATALDTLPPREREVLALMAEGRTNHGIATAFTVSERAVEKHIANIFTKLDLPPSETGHRRVLAVLRYLEATG